MHPKLPFSTKMGNCKNEFVLKFKHLIVEKYLLIYFDIVSYVCIYVCIQGVPGGMDKISGECSLC